MEGKIKYKILYGIGFIFLIILALIWIVPILWCLSTSLKLNENTYTYPIKWIPNPITIKNYLTVLTSGRGANIGLAFINSTIVSALTIFLTLIIDSLAAYPLARMEFKGKPIVFAIVVGSLFIPIYTVLVPRFMMFWKLSLLNTYWCLIFPALASSYGVFMLRQFMLSIPKELEEAALIDGCSRMRTFWTIIFPLTRPALATLSLFTFLSSWNDYLWPLLTLNDPTKMTLPVALTLFRTAYGNWEMGTVMAAAFTGAAPTLIVYFFTQKMIVKGMLTSGLKG
jgi:ABC-type glycerol-3-phosphate transport system permease component